MVAIAALAWSCSPSQSGRMTIAVSILPQKQVVSQIAGDAVEVLVMVPAGSSPEAYDPTPQDFIRLGRSTLYFAVGGLDFERAWIPRLSAQSPAMRIVDTSADGRREAGLTTHATPEATDPHVWTSPRQLKAMGKAVRDALSEADTARAATYATNYERFATRMDSLHARVARLCRMASSQTFVIYHPALTAFADEFGLTQIAVERGHREPSAAELGALIEEIRATDARVLFMQQEFDTRLVATLAAETGLRVVAIHPLAEDWENEMIRIAVELSR